ncbi:hypothetical protein PpBr36_02158 [Pyricularia pennisetigena]|uniref:hypothetical protein n=1 Tax=Pyricularia pennisetigena TaxID=1578925 RepID=UPI00114E4814|nr:hypothetical protein PpBr36_02158 [Pyricularia pennisetigena]TLS29327.1 hypothetical protein PpBr36_02158 [Pyricularia pennisetigena]
MADTKDTSVPVAKRESVDHVDYTGPTMASDRQLIEAAVKMSEEEAKLPRKELFSRYWPAAVYSMILSAALIMEGMDVGLVNNFFGQDAYRKKFGWPDETGKYQISASWQAAIGNGNNLGSIIGLLLNGYLQSRFGSRRVYMGAMALMAGTIFILFFATSVQMLFVGNIFCGIPWGVFQTLATAYAAEICPPAMRGYLTAWTSMCWGCGSFLAAGVLRGSLQLPGDWAWKMPYGLQWVWIPPLFLAAFLAPENPWYLVRRGKIEEAERSLHRLARKGHYTQQSMAETLALMKHTNEMEKLEAENANYMDCFRGTNLRRTGISCMAWVIQILNGQSIAAFATTFLRTSGMDEVQAFNFSMGIQSVNIVATGIAIVLMGHVGRRDFYLYGTSGIGLIMLIIGVLGVLPPGSINTGIGVGVAMVLVNAIFKITLGPACFVIVSEISATRVRAQTMVLGRAVYVIGQIVVNQINPRMLNQGADAWNWGAKTGWFYFGLCSIWIVWIFFFLPETKNRTFADIDYLFQKKVPARKFGSANVNLFEFSHADNSAKTLDDGEGLEEAAPQHVSKS